MRILKVIPGYEPAWSFGGTVSASSQLCRAYARQEHSIVVYTTNADGQGAWLDVPLNEPQSLGGVEIWYFKGRIGHLKTFYASDMTKKLRRTIDEFEVVHIAALWQWIQYDISRLCRAARKPYVVSTHGSLMPLAWAQSSLKKRAYWKLIARGTLLNASAIHFTTEMEQENAWEMFSELRSVPSFVVPNGIDTQAIEFAIDKRSELNISADSLVLLFVGRIHRIKDIGLLFDSLRFFKGEVLTLVMLGPVGDEDYANALKKQAKEMIHRVIWEPEVSGGHVWDYYAMADLVVMPSKSENFSMVLVEAMACGVPTLTTRRVGVWKHIEDFDAGFVVKPEAEAFAEIFALICQNRAILNEKSKNTKRLVQEVFEINQVAQQMHAAYQNMIAMPK
jgi:glycosyltransferase involved in cell wall biosynthesis